MIWRSVSTSATRRLVAGLALVFVAGGAIWDLVDVGSQPARHGATPAAPSTTRIVVPQTAPLATHTAPPLPEVLAATPPKATMRVPGVSAPFVVAHGAVWTTSCADQICGSGELMSIDTTTLRSRSSTQIRLAPVGVAASTDGVWVLSERLDGTPYHVTLVDSITGQVRFETDVPSQATGGTNPGVHLTATPGTVWVAHYTRGTPELDRVDLATGAVSVIILPVAAYRLAVDAHSVWIAAFDAAQVLQVDIATNHVTRIAAGPEAAYTWSITATENAAWITTVYRDSTKRDPSQHLVRIEATTHQVTAFSLPVITVAAGEGQLWGLVYDVNRRNLDQQGFVGQIDPRTGRFVRTVNAPIASAIGQPSGGPNLAIASGHLWTDDEPNGIYRVTP